MEGSKTLRMAKLYLGRQVEIIIDRPLGSKHPRHGFIYEVNYGYIPNTRVPDGGELDAYFLGVSEPLTTARGTCVAIIHRPDDDDDKLVVVPKDREAISDDEIQQSVRFQEQWFEHEIVR